jgi:hypothetical protein
MSITKQLEKFLLEELLGSQKTRCGGFFWIQRPALPRRRWRSADESWRNGSKPWRWS